jgi:DNA (cytosine-5)-methyltransferase 1
VIRGLDLFSGIGGIALALKPWVKTVAYCECEPYAQAVLMERMASGDLDSAPIWDDVRTLRREILDTEIDIISGGFPCQDVSVAGAGKGLEGERSSLFFQIARLTAEYRPRFIFLENVPAICTRGGVEVIESLTSLGYDARWGVLSAFDMGAPHLRERWWCLAYSVRELIRNKPRGSRGEKGESSAGSGDNGEKEPVAHSNCDRKPQPERGECEQRRRACNGGEDVANAMRLGRGTRRTELQRLARQSETPGGGASRNADDGKEQSAAFRADWWELEPDVDRVVDGLPYRVDRIKALGNSVVPQTAREAFERLMGMK